MKSLRRASPELVLFSMLMGIGPSTAQTPQSSAVAAQQSPALVRAVRVVVEKDWPTVEIVSSRPINPKITKLEGPLRLVIDLPNATLALPRKRIDFRSQEISAVRVDQYQSKPAIARVVVDLLSPTAYTWDAAGNRLMVRLHPAEEPARASEPPTVTGFTSGVQPVAVPVSPGTSGTMVMAGSRVASGSSVTAGADAASLRLARGGEVRVCPGTTVSVTSSPDGHSLMLGMSTGALEAHYTLDTSADSVLTPDFRILLAGPGMFHYAISADSHGNTCVRALPGNTASAIVSELIGNGTYQVKPAEQVVFRAGQLKLINASLAPSCGCPAPAVPVMRASAPTGPVVPEESLPSSVRLAQPGEEIKPVPPPVSASSLRSSGTPSSEVALSVIGPEAAALPPSKPDDVHVQVDAPLVYRAADPSGTPSGETERPAATEPSPTATLQTATPAPVAQAPPKREHHGVFGKIRGFFAALFR